MTNNKTLESKGHEGRDDLAGEHKAGDMGQIILFIVFLIVWILDSFIFKYSTFLSQYISIYVRIAIAVLLLIFSGYFAKAGLNIVFGEIRKTPSIIRKGVFGIVRHPVYFGSILFYLGLLIFTCSLAATVIWIIIIGFYHYIATYEEKLLLDKFGDDYKKYMVEVPMWMPRIRKR